jgi:hypothetical protein
VEAHEQATIRAIADATAESSGGSAFGDGLSLAVNGVLAVNVVLSDAGAFIVDSDVTATGGDILVDAQNTSTLGAENKNAVNSGASSVGLTLAFNTIGYDAQNLLFDTFDALLGLAPTAFDYDLTDPGFTDPDSLQENDRVKQAENVIFRYVGPDDAGPIDLQGENYLNPLRWRLVTPAFADNPAQVHAYIQDSTIEASGNLTVTASALTQLEARTSNAATAAAAALFGASAMSISGALASNKVSSSAKAYIEFDGAGAQGTVDAAGDVLVAAADQASIDSTTNMVAAASKTNDLGLGIVNDLYNTLTGDYQFTTNSGIADLVFGNQVRLDDVDHFTDDPPTRIAQGDWVQLSSDVANGTEGQTYEYLDSAFIDGSGPLGKVDFDLLDFSDTGLWREIKGTAGAVYQYMGEGGDIAVDRRDLALEDYTDFEFWKELSENNVIPGSISTALLKDNKLDTGKSKSFYGLVSRNDLNSVVEAYILNASVRDPLVNTDGPNSVSVTAIEAAELTATDTSVISSQSQSGGFVATNNQLRSAADAYIQDSDVRLQDGGTGDVIVSAGNYSILDASSLTSSTGSESVGAVVSFNAMGWEASNIFFQALEALLGDNILTGTQPTRAHATILDSEIVAGGDVRVTAESAALMSATSGNEQKATPTNSFLINKEYGSKAMSAGGMLASNKVASEAKALIDYTPGYAGAKNVTAAGIVEVSARDEAGIEADSSLAVQAVATNNLDAFTDVAIALGLDDYEFTTASGTQTVVSGLIFGKGTRVRLADDYDGPSGEDYGDGGAVYEYVGLGPELFDTLDLSQEDFTDPVWQKVNLGLDDARLNIGNLSASPASAFGGLVVLNDVRSEAEAKIEDTTVNAGEVLVSATENASIQATARSNIESSGGSAFKELGEGSVIAANGLIATNLVQSQADASIVDSSITTTATGTTGDLTVEAKNTSGVDARMLARTDTGEKGGGIVLAFNTLGYESQNVLFSTLEAIIGDPLVSDTFGTETPARAHATITNSSLDAAGAILVQSDNAAQLNATVSNAAVSAASALFDAGGWSAAGVVASNKISTSAKASIDNSAMALVPGTPDVEADGAVTVQAADNAGIFANVKLVSSSITTNDGGASVVNEALADAVPVDYVSTEGQRELVLGDRVRLDNGHTDGGNAGSIYVYMGEGGNPEDGRDLSVEDFSDTDYWKEALETELIPQGVNFTPSDSQAVGGIVVYNELDSSVLAFIKGAVVDADGNVQVSATENATMRSTADSQVESSGGNAFGKGKSQAYNGVLSTNVMLSTADAYIIDGDVTTTSAGDLLVQAHNTSQMDATTAAATTSGADTVGVLLSFNVAGFDSQNVLFATFDALLGLSELTEELESELVDYDLNDDPAQVAATLAEGEWVKLTTGEIYEYIGDERSSVPLNAEDYNDADLWKEVNTPFGNEQPIRAQAYIRDTAVDADGAVTVEATNTATMNAKTTNDATAVAGAFFGASGMSGSGVLSSNKLSGSAKAFIEFTGSQGTVEADGVITVRADDATALDAFMSMANTSSATNDLGAGLLNDFVNDLETEYQYTTKSGTQDLVFGEMVLVASDYVLPGSPVDGAQETVGKLFRFMGDEEVVDLSAEDYSDYERWKEITEDNLIPGAVANAARSAFGKAGGKSKSFYGGVVRNDVRGKAEAYLGNVDADAASVEVSAVEQGTMVAYDQSIVSAGSQAGGGIVTTNQLQAQAIAKITDSDVTTLSGDVTVNADNVATLEATSNTKSSAAESVGIVLSFNTIGWDASNILFQAIDALLGTDAFTSLFEDDQDGAIAFIEDSKIDSAGDVSVTADASANLTATTGNEQVAKATNTFVLQAKDGKKSMAAGGMMASNKVKSQAQAYIDNTGTAHTVSAGGTLTVEARDEASVRSESTLVSQAISTNDLSAVTDVLGNLIPDDYTYTTATGEVKYRPEVPGTDLAFDVLGLEQKSIFFGDRVRVGSTYGLGGDTGSVYKLIAILTLDEVIDLSTEDYSDQNRWQKITGGADDLDDLYPNLGNLTASPAKAFGGLVVMNDVRSDVDAYIEDVNVTSAGAVKVSAVESAQILSLAQSTVESSGGSAFKELGEGSVIAANGVIATNIVQSQADASIADSSITTTNGATSGDVRVLAFSASGVDARVLARTDTGEKGGGIVLAFNTLGWEASNLLFNTFERLRR